MKYIIYLLILGILELLFLFQNWNILISDTGRLELRYRIYICRKQLVKSDQKVRTSI